MAVLTAPILENISFAGYLTNGKMRNNKTTSVTVSKLHAETRMSSVDMSFSLENPDRIQYKIRAGIETDLSEFRDYIPDTVISDAKGQLSARIDTKGVLGVEVLFSS